MYHSYKVENDAENEKRERLRKQRDAIKRVFDTPDGEQIADFLSDIALGTFGVYMADTNATVFAEGQRNIIVALLVAAGMDFNKYAQFKLRTNIEEDEED